MLSPRLHVIVIGIALATRGPFSASTQPFKGTIKYTKPHQRLPISERPTA